MLIPRSKHPKKVLKMDGSVLILDQQLLLPTLRSSRDQTLSSGMDHKVCLKWLLSLKDPFKCLMILLQPQKEELSQSLVVVIPLLSSKEFLDLLRNFPTLVLEVVPLS